LPASFIRDVASGSTDTFSVPFAYLEKTHVDVYLNGVVQSPSTYTWPTTASIKFTAGNPAAGTVVMRRRRTYTDPLVTYKPGSLDTKDLDRDSKQAIYLAEEARDQADDIERRVMLFDPYAVGSPPVIGDTGRDILEAGTVPEVLGILGVPTNGEWRYSLRDFPGVLGNGSNDDTAGIVLALAAGVPLTGEGRVYAVTGKVSIPAGTSLWDVEFKQLAPGASLNVITLEADTQSNLDLRRVTVNRNGDGTNGGLLNGSPGTIGALNTAFGMRFIACANSHFEDLEVYGSDSGTGILFRQIGETSRIIRPYVHDMNYVRAAASDDNCQGLWWDQCTRMEVEAPRVINMSGTVGGVASRRWTRAMGIGGCVGVRFSHPYMEHVDQGFDITGGPTPNQDIVVESPVSKDMPTYGVKLANTARRCRVVNGTAYDCGVGFVASPQSIYTPDVTTDHSYFINCVAYNTGSLAAGVVAAGGFRVLETGASDQGRARNIWFINCLAVDEQTVKTMEYGFMSEITDINVAPWFINCESIGHISGVKQGLWRTHPDAVGTVAQTSGVPTGAIIERGNNANGHYVRYLDGTQICWHTIDDTAGAYTTAHGSSFVRATPVTWTFPAAFLSTPMVGGNVERGADGLAFGLSIRGAATTTANFTPYGFVSLGAGNAKSLHVVAHGRWY
jgi:hypothetical protein